MFRLIFLKHIVNLPELTAHLCLFFISNGTHMSGVKGNGDLPLPGRPSVTCVRIIFCICNGPKWVE